jgi:hypothetical protein
MLDVFLLLEMGMSIERIDKMTASDRKEWLGIKEYVENTRAKQQERAQRDLMRQYGKR